MFHKPVLFKPANAGQKQLWTSKVSLLLLFVCHSCNSITARSSQFFFSHVFSNHDLCLRIDFGCKLFKSSIIIGLKGIHPRLCTQGPHAFNQSAFMLTRSTALLLAAIFEYEYYGVYTTSAQRSEIQGPMPVSLPSSGPGPEGGDDDGGGSD